MHALFPEVCELERYSSVSNSICTPNLKCPFQLYDSNPQIFYKWLSCHLSLTETNPRDGCITANGKILKQSRDHSHAHFVGDMSSLLELLGYILPVYKI